MLTIEAVISNLINDDTKRNAEGRKTKTRKQTGDNRRKLNKEVLGTILNNNEKAINTRTELSDEGTNGAGRGNNGTDKGTDRRETEAADERSEFRRQLHEEGGSSGASDGESTVNLGANIGEEFAGSSGALDVLSDGVDDCTNGNGERGQEASDEGSDGRAELDEEDLGVFAGDDDYTLGVGTEFFEEVTDAGGSGDHGAEGLTDAGEAKAVDESGNLGGKLDEEFLGVGAGDGEGLVDLWAEISDDFTGVRGVGWGGKDGSREEGEGSESELHLDEFVVSE
ncbi:hypothetical protein EIK77_004461 [Talaromyces pinophilus]|nr:hypothetical protein EIK77_004461 [Talaromyces pinophilus]